MCQMSLRSSNPGVVVHLEFKQGLPKIGLVKMPHYRSKVYNDLDVVVHIWYRNFDGGDVCLSSVSPQEFAEFLNAASIRTILTTSMSNTYCIYTILTRYKLDRMPLMVMLSWALASHHTESIGKISNHLDIEGKDRRIILYVSSRMMDVRFPEPKNPVEWRKPMHKCLKAYSRPISKAETLYMMHREYPDPIKWIKTGYQTPDHNEYTDYMNSYNFDDLRDQNKRVINNALVKLGENPSRGSRG